MSIVSLLIGQCGNQVGGNFYNTVFKDCYEQPTTNHKLNQEYVDNSIDSLFNQLDGHLEARCVQVDMEEKVISQMQSDALRSDKWCYPSGSSYSGKRGSGNNWSFGFLINGPACESAVRECLRRELEKCDSVDGIISVMSLAGGTGSGVGTYLLRNIDAICPKVPILARVVCPYKHGEISTQAFNALLSLGHLLAQQNSTLDGILVHENDVLHTACSKRLGNSINVPLSEVNSLMSHQLAGVLQPISQPAEIGRRRLSKFLLSLAGPADFLLYRLRCLPYLAADTKKFSTETWPQLAGHGRQLIFTGAAIEDDINWSLSNSTIVGFKRQPLLAFSSVFRGKDACEYATSTSSTGFLDSLQCKFTHDSFHPQILANNRPFLGYQKSLFLAINGGGLLPNDPCLSGSDPASVLRCVSNRAWQLFSARAYLHQYTQYGLEMDTFMDCFAVVDQISHSYAQLAI